MELSTVNYYLSLLVLCGIGKRSCFWSAYDQCWGFWAKFMSALKLLKLPPRRPLAQLPWLGDLVFPSVTVPPSLLLGEQDLALTPRFTSEKLRHQAEAVLLEKVGHRREVLRLSLCQLLPISSDTSAVGKFLKQGLWTTTCSGSSTGILNPHCRLLLNACTWAGQALPCKVEAVWENYHLIVYGKTLIL